MVDDEQDARCVLGSILRTDQHFVWEASGVPEAQRILAANTIDVVITGSRLADGEGTSALNSADSAVSVIFLVAAASPEFATVPLGPGIVEFLNKPVQPDVVRAAVHRACERTRLLRENNFLKEHVARLQSLAHVRGSNLEADPGRLSVAPPASDQPASQPSVAGLPQFFDLTALLEKTEKDAILQTLAASGGVQAEAARRMGLSRSALSYKLSKYGIPSRKKQPESTRVSQGDEGFGQNAGAGSCEV